MSTLCSAPPVRFSTALDICTPYIDKPASGLFPEVCAEVLQAGVADQDCDCHPLAWAIEELECCCDVGALREAGEYAFLSGEETSGVDGVLVVYLQVSVD